MSVEMPTHMLHTVRNHRLRIFMPDEPGPEEESVILIMRGREFSMGPAAFRQFVACIVDADEKLFAAHWGKPDA